MTTGLCLRSIAPFAFASLVAAAAADSPKPSNVDGPDPGLPPGVPASEANIWKLVWRDEFDGSALDPSKWSPRYSGPREGATITEECATVEKGMFRLWVKEKDGGLLNAAMWTRGKFETKYGIFAARIRVPRQQNQRSFMWLLPATDAQADNDPSTSGAQIHIFDWGGAGRTKDGSIFQASWPGAVNGKVQNNALKTGGEMSVQRLLPEGKDLSDDFHVFSVEWCSQGYIFRMDGKETFRTSDGVSQVPEFILLSLRTWSDEAKRLDRSLLPNAMDVDWVRVWQPTAEPRREFPK